MKNSDNIGNRSRDLPVCSAVPQPLRYRVPLRTAVTRSWIAAARSIPKEAFADSFQKLYERCQPCVVKDGDYFDGQ
jgi:hypothetical protein